MEQDDSIPDPSAVPRLHLDGDDLLAEIPAALIVRLESNDPGVGVRDGYQVWIGRRQIADALAERLRDWHWPEGRWDVRQIEAWADELGRLEVRIPRSYETFGIEIFLDEHPEHRDQVEATLRRSRALRRQCEFVIGEIYAHYSTGSPSIERLIASLRSLAADLELDAAAS